MKIFSFKEFVEKTEGKLDSIHGNRGLDDYSLIVCHEAVEDKAIVETIKELSEAFKEDVYYVDKGGTDLYKFIESIPVEDLGKTKGGTYYIQFEQDVRVYNSLFGIFMNVVQVILPPKSTVVPKVKRLYILREKCGARLFYKLPFLEYPSSIKDFLKWAKKKKKFKFKVSDFEIWNKNETLDDWNLPYYPVKNLKTEEDIVSYNSWITSDYKEFVKDKLKERSLWRSAAPEKIAKIPDPILINVTQDDIKDFCDDYNNRFKIRRK
jgi:hypothetical protein